MALAKLERAHWTGCCAACTTAGPTKSLTGHASVNFRVFDLEDKETLEFFKGEEVDVVKLEGCYMAVFSSNHAAQKVKRRQMKIHEELQKRDGRALEEFKEGDLIWLVSNTPPAKGNLKYYVGPKIPNQGIHVCQLKSGNSYEKSVVFHTVYTMHTNYAMRYEE
jgi:hypothetical protein